MIHIRNMGSKEFTNYIQDKKVYIFGAGMLTENCIKIYCNEKEVEAIIDNNKKLWGKKKIVCDHKIEIINVETFASTISRQNIDDVVLLIVPTPYVTEIIRQLDNIESLNGLNCFIHAFIRNVKEIAPKYEFSKGTQKIPKTIHYFWIGEKEIPDFLQKCIDSWHIYNPDYKIVRWDEKNYDFSKNLYMKEAYENKAWGFATDYARLDVIYQYGGIYLDTDVEVIRNLDVVLCDDAFFNMGASDIINTGTGFGAVAGNQLIKEQMDYYDDKHFIMPNGKENRVCCYYYQHPIFEKHGFQIKNEYQKLNNIVIYPSEVMSPKGTWGMGDFFSEKTLSIHHESGTWRNEREREGNEELHKLFEEKFL